MKSDLGAATAQLKNRHWRFGLWLLSLPEGDKAREAVGAHTGIGRQLKNTLAHGGQRERTVPLKETETLDAELLQEEEAEAKAEGTRPGLTMFSDGSRLDDGVTGYSVVWKKRQTWAWVKVHMGNNREAYDAECAALARALELASQRNAAPERVTIFLDAQAAIRRIASDEPGPGQQYALQTRKHIATLHLSRPGIVIEVQWCPAHKGVAGNEKADECAKVAAEKSGTRGVEWPNFPVRTVVRGAPLTRSLANLKREISEKKWAEARQWAGAEPPRRSTACRTAKSPVARWPTAPRGSPRGSTR